VDYICTSRLSSQHGPRAGFFIFASALPHLYRQVSSVRFVLLRIVLLSTNGVISASSVFGRIVPPYFADQIGSFNVVTISAGMSGVCMLALWLPFNYHSSHAGLIVFALAYGFFSGAFVSLLMPCVAKAGNIETLGRRFGTFQIVMSIRYRIPIFLFDDCCS
jgi:MFS family permease